MFQQSQQIIQNQTETITNSKAGLMPCSQGSTPTLGTESDLVPYLFDK